MELIALEDPEVLAREGELKGHGGDEVPLPRKFLNFKSKNGAFLCTVKH